MFYSVLLPIFRSTHAESVTVAQACNVLSQLLEMLRLPEVDDFTAAQACEAEKFY